MTIGEKIKVLRKERGMTQEMLANQLSVSRQTISSWESDLTSPDLNQAKDICLWFGIHLDELISLDVLLTSKNNEASLLHHFIGKVCTLDVLNDEMDEQVTGLVLEIRDHFIKIEKSDKKEKMIQLLDLSLVQSIVYIKEERR